MANSPDTSYQNAATQIYLEQGGLQQHIPSGCLIALEGGSIVSDDGTAQTGTSGAGGNANNVPVTAGAGGNTASTGSDNAGNGGSVTITAGNGGNATAGTGNGGSGGNVNLVPGTGGTTTGGTAGAAGEVQFNGSSVGIENALWLQLAASAPSAGSQTIFLAARAYRVKAISVVFSTASTSGTAQVNKDTSTNAPGAGTALMTGTVSLAGTANTVVNGTLVATAATLQLAAGDRLSVTFGGTLTSLAGCTIVVALVPI